MSNSNSDSNNPQVSLDIEILKKKRKEQTKISRNKYNNKLKCLDIPLNEIVSDSNKMDLDTNFYDELQSSSSSSNLSENETSSSSSSLKSIN